MSISTIYEWRLGGDFMSISKGPNAVIKINNYVYLFTDYEVKNNIAYKAEIKNDDTLSEFKMINLNISTNNQRSSYVYTGKRVYEIGGEKDNTITNSINYFNVLLDGNLGKQKKSRNFIIPISRAALCYLNNKIYVIGGQTSNNQLLDTIYSVELNDNHTIKKMTKEDVTLFEHLCDTTALVYKKNIYCFGGKNGDYSTNKCFRVNFDEDDKIKILEQKPLPERLTKPACVILGEKVYVIGYRKDDTFIRVTYAAYFDPYGNIDTWVEDLKMPYNVDDLVAVNNNTSFLLIGGVYGNTSERLVLYPNFNKRSINKDDLDYKKRESIKRQISLLNVLILLLILLIILFFIYLETI